jgi:NhaC family Na+:H+ antiporter
VVGSIKGIFVGYTLFIALVIFSILALTKGFTPYSIVKMIYSGGKKTFLVLQIFILIGAIVSSWMAAGTVPAIVFYGLKYMNANLFILSAFIISSAVSFLIGTSFGTIGTVGIALMVMARSGNVSTAATAGAIIAGAYFGDRCSPMSSSANLVASITGTELYDNIKKMLRTSIVPFTLSLVAYTFISLKYPISTGGSSITTDIEAFFEIGLIAMIPAAIILLMSFFRVNVKLSMLISILSAVFIAIVFQHNSFMDSMRYILLGYKMKSGSYLADIITGGGIVSMLKVSVVVFISSSFTGVFEGTGMLKSLERYTEKANNPPLKFLTTIIVSIAASAFGCTQVMAAMLTHMLMKKSYDKSKTHAAELAVDLENTAIVIAPLIPWNIAVLVPLTTLNAGINSIPFSVYLYLLPAWNLIEKAWSYKKQRTRNLHFPGNDV